LDALRKLSRFSTSPDFDRLIWPDGGRINEPQLEENDLNEVAPNGEKALESKADLIPVDSTYSGSFSMAFNFEPDQELHDYDLEWREVLRQQGTWIGPMLKDGRYFIEGIQLTVSLQAEASRWFGDSPFFVCLQFEAGHEQMSSLFHASMSVRRFFDDLSVELGAALCILSVDSKPDYIMVERYKYGIHPGWFSDFDRAEDFDAAVKVSPYLSRSENQLQQKARYCASQEREFVRLLIYIQESESNLRARAYSALNDEDKDLVATVLKAGLDDEDWRVRAVVVESLSLIHSPMVEATLLKTLEDPHPEVSSIACKKLHSFHTEVVFEALLEIVENAPLTPLNLGLFRNALEGMRVNEGGWNAAAILEKRLNEPDFPFPKLAEEVIERLKTIPENGEPEA
jgi:hypothetical protein